MHLAYGFSLVRHSPPSISFQYPRALYSHARGVLRGAFGAGGNPAFILVLPSLWDIDRRVDGVQARPHGVRVMTACGVQQGVDGWAQHG